MARNMHYQGVKPWLSINPLRLEEASSEKTDAWMSKRADGFLRVAEAKARKAAEKQARQERRAKAAAKKEARRAKAARRMAEDQERARKRREEAQKVLDRNQVSGT